MATGELTFGSLFSGIGGFDLGFERAGLVCRWQVENDNFCRRVLSRHWPNVTKYGDIREVDFEQVEAVDVICGGFPCQPVSVAGKLRAQADDRWLWPEFARAIRHLRPAYVAVENVPGLLVRGMGDVLGDLAALGYDAEWQVLSAAAFGAPHLRERVFVVGYSHGDRRKTRRNDHSEYDGNISSSDGQHSNDVADANTGRRQRARDISEGEGFIFERADFIGSRARERGFAWWEIEPAVGRVADGFPGRVDRLHALGNSVIPQATEFIGQCIVEHHKKELDRHAHSTQSIRHR